MTMQARMSANDQRLYNPSRDVAHNFEEVMRLVASRLEDHVWPELDGLLARENINLDDLGEACGAYCSYLASAVNEPNLAMEAALHKSNFLACKPAAQVAIMAMIGVCYAGIQFAGIRDASVAGDGPLYTVETLMVHAERFRAQAGRSRWQRRWDRFKARVRDGWAALRKS